VELGASGILYDEAFHHASANFCFCSEHGHRVPTTLWSGDLLLGQRLRDVVRRTVGADRFLLAGEVLFDLQYQLYSLSYFRISPGHIPAERYSDPFHPMMIAVTGFDDREVINRALLYRCGFGTVYEGLEKIGVSGNDAILVVGLGPVGLAALMLARSMGANKLIGVDVVEERLQVTQKLGLADHVIKAGPNNVEEIRSLTGGYGVERAFDASGSDKGRLTAIQATRKWGKIALVGEGGTLGLSPSPDLIHDQKTVYGSWVTSIWLMEDLVERIVRWKIHPEDLVTNRFPLEKADEAYALMATGKSGKVAVVFDEELK
jgi:hypothetical protein